MAANRQVCAGVALACFLIPSVVCALDVGKLRNAENKAEVAYRGLTVGELEHMSVSDQNRVKVGEIKRVLINGNNRVVAVVLELDERYGDRQIIVEINALSLTPISDTSFVTWYSEAQIANLPTWNDN